MNKQKGFTVIELVIVIAIIAILAAIILINITGYNNKGKDVAAKGDLSTLITNATAYYTDITKGNSSYLNFITGGPLDIVNGGDSTYLYVYNALVKAGYAGFNGSGYSATCNTGNCSATPAATAWCACIKLKSVSNTYYCVDSRGIKKETSTVCSSECNYNTATPGLCI